MSALGYRLTGRNFGMDLFRVLAEFSILIGHLMMWVAYATATPHMDFLLIVASIGLEFFFVMSGFLIGGMLLDITDKGVTLERWGRFTLRRMLRVLPPYLVWLLVLWVLFPPTGGGVKQLLQYLTFTQNLAWPAVSGRWFDVSWSLSVEFWFYLGFGSLSLLAFAFFRRPGFLLVMLAFILLPLIARILYQDMENWDEGMRKVVVFRLDAIAYGVLLVYLLRYSARIMQWRLPLAWFGSLLLLGSVSWWWGSEMKFDIDGGFSKVWLLNLISIGVVLVFPWVLQLRCERAWLVKVVEWLSDSSYAVYLVHLTVAGWCVGILVSGYPLLFVLASIMGSLFLGGISLYFIERPILRRRPV